MTRWVREEWLREVMGAELKRLGLPERQRGEVIAGVLFGSQRGIDSHGVALFRTYARELMSGRAKSNPEFRYRRQRPAITRLDADGALGMVAGFEASRTAAALATENGVGVVVVANSNHFGPASLFATALARNGLVGMAMTNSDALVVPVNGRKAMLGTNPISVAVEAEGGQLFCADLSTSQGSFLKGRALARAGAGLPQGIFADESGTDAALSGLSAAGLLPLGGYKGQCLGMTVSILCALLGGAPFDWEIVNLFDEPFDEPRRVSHLLIAIDVRAVVDEAVFRQRLSEYLRAFREAPAVADKSVRCPGDLEAECAAVRATSGIPLDDEDYEYLRALEIGFGDAREPAAGSSG